MKPNLSPSC